jgi:hypothetical protein
MWFKPKEVLQPASITKVRPLKTPPSMIEAALGAEGISPEFQDLVWDEFKMWNKPEFQDPILNL